MARRPPGSALLLRFLKENKLTRGAAGKALGVSKTSVIFWIQGKQRPELDLRAAIERWTGGAVPASSWLRPGEEPRAARVAPFSARAA